jgi:hypothetical protein
VLGPLGGRLAHILGVPRGTINPGHPADLGIMWRGWVASLAVVGASVALIAARERSELRDPSSPARLRAALRKAPDDGRIHARLALALLRPTAAIAPNTDDESLYGSDFTLHHPDATEARTAVDAALKATPRALETHLAETAVLMAEGRGEDAIQPGRRAVEAAPKTAHAQVELARAHLLAACAQGCAARESLRVEKRAEQKAGRRKTALEAREEEGRRQQEAKQKREHSDGRGELSDRGSLRAGAMWRIMEAGRILQQAAADEPANDEVRKLARDAKKLTKLDAHKVLSTEQVMAYAQCHYFFGQQLDGSPCDMKRFKYE